MAPRKKKIPVIETPGHDPAVEAIVSGEFATMPDLKALDVALALQQILRGQNSLLSQQETMGLEIARLKSQMDKYDQASAKYNENREKYIQDILDKSSSLKAVGSKKDKLIAKGTQMFQEEIQKARAINATDKLRFEAELRNGPKVKYISPGRWETGMVSGGQPITQIVPEEVRIKHKRWVLPPGVEVEIPEAVFKILQERRRSEAETVERQAALGKIMNNDDLNVKLREIDKKYNTHSSAPFEE